MINKDTVKIAVQLLCNVYKDDYKAAATICNAQAKFLETGETKTLVEALAGVREFVDDLIKAIEE